jgi:type II secretory ATPase GspE/PulE/Tfp pilus assembly ATPase PilB-like protein
MTRLHAKDAAGAIHRLFDMGIPPYDLANSLLMTSSQRLIRRVCPDCSEEVTYPAEMIEAWLALAESEGLLIT